MTEKRFEYYEHKGADYILDTPNKSLDFIEMLGDCLEAEKIVDLLNELNDENEQLKQSYKEFEDECQSTFNAMNRKQNDLYRKNFKLKEANEELKHQNELLFYDLEQLRNKKERYKRLSEIRQQQINNRILTIKDFINNCSDNKVRSVLKELFYSEVNEYDLSLENRKLLNENEKLKQQISDSFNQSNCITVQKSIISDLKKENEQLKSTIKKVTELLEEEVDLFSEKATEHDINAYVELKELDNKDAYYMATATKKAIRMLKELLE